MGDGRTRRTPEQWNELDDRKFEEDYERYLEHDANFLLRASIMDPSPEDDLEMMESAEYVYNFSLHWCATRKYGFWLRRDPNMREMKGMLRSIENTKGYVLYRDEEREKQVMSK